MSFPKAKILRFNEEMSCAPPPGKYDPKLDVKVKGAVIEKSKRFSDPKNKDGHGSLESLDSISSCCSKSCASSSNHIPTTVFRTPQLPKKRAVATPRSAMETVRSVRTPTTPTPLKSKKKLNDMFTQEREKNLLEQISELTRVHSSQLLEKDMETEVLLKEIAELKNTVDKLENSREMFVNDIRSEFEDKINRVTKELEITKNNLEEEKIAHEKTLNDFKAQIKILEENVKNCNSINIELENELAGRKNCLVEVSKIQSELEEELKEAKEKIENMVKEHGSEILSLRKRSADEIEGIATAAELNVDLITRQMEEKLKMFQKEVENRSADNQTEFTGRVEQIMDMVKEKSKLFDSQTADLFQILKTMENNFGDKIDDFIGSLNVCSEWYDGKLKVHVKTLEELEAQKACNLEQKIILVELQDKIESLEDDVNRFRKQCKKYEVIQSEASKTIQVLSQRLFESETEVEKQNSIRCELKLRINALEEKVKILIQENGQLKTQLSELEVAIIKDVKEIENVLHAKVEGYRRKAVEESQQLRKALEEKQSTVEMMVGELDYYRAKALETSEYVSLCQNRITCYKEEIKDLSLKFNELDDEHNDKMNAQKNLYNLLNLDYSNLKNKYDNEKARLTKDIEEMALAKACLEKECSNKSEELQNLKIELEEAKTKIVNAERDISLLKEANFEYEQNIENFALKLDHYTECAQKSSQQLSSLSTINQEMEKENQRLGELMNEKEMKLETLTAELEESKSYVESVTEHFVSLMNELGEKDRKYEALSHDMDIKNVNMIQVSEEYEKMKGLYEAECIRVSDLERDLQEVHRDNEKYVDEVISELVLEKERCTELGQNLEEETAKNKALLEKVERIEEVKGNGKIEELNRRIRLLEGNIEEMKEEKIDLNNELDALYKEIEEHERNTEELERKKNELSSVVIELEAEKGDLMGMIRQQQEEMELMSNEISRQQEMIDELKQMKEDKVEDMRAQYEAEVQNEVLGLQQSMEELERMVGELESREQDLVYKLKAAEGDLTAAEVDKKKSEERTKELAEKNGELAAALSAMEKRKNEYKMYAAQLEQDFKKIKEENHLLTEERDKLKEQSDEDSMKNTSLLATIADLECRNRELESIIGPFRQQLMQYEGERAALLSKTASTQKELRALELAHAQALGHQNHRQKIKHVVHLTEQITELKTEIEKLRVENTKLRVAALEAQKDASLRGRKKDKENPEAAKSPRMSRGAKVERQSSPALKERVNTH